jgi:hypothetical protein
MEQQEQRPTAHGQSVRDALHAAMSVQVTVRWLSRYHRIILFSEICRECFFENCPHLTYPPSPTPNHMAQPHPRPTPHLPTPAPAPFRKTPVPVPTPSFQTPLGLRFVSRVEDFAKASVTWTYFIVLGTADTSKLDFFVELGYCDVFASEDRRVTLFFYVYFVNIFLSVQMSVILTIYLQYSARISNGGLLVMATEIDGSTSWAIRWFGRVNAEVSVTVSGADIIELSRGAITWYSSFQGNVGKLSSVYVSGPGCFFAPVVHPSPTPKLPPPTPNRHTLPPHALPPHALPPPTPHPVSLPPTTVPRYHPTPHILPSPTPTPTQAPHPTSRPLLTPEPFPTPVPTPHLTRAPTFTPTPSRHYLTPCAIMSVKKITETRYGVPYVTYLYQIFATQKGTILKGDVISLMIWDKYARGNYVRV